MFLVRFPEELNGVGCFGANILRVLAGSGYSLHWYPASGAAQGMYAQVTVSQTTSVLPMAPVTAPLPPPAPMNITHPVDKRLFSSIGTDAIGNTRRKVSARVGVKSSARCGCLYGDTTKRWEMIVKTNKYAILSR